MSTISRHSPANASMGSARRTVPNTHAPTLVEYRTHTTEYRPVTDIQSPTPPRRADSHDSPSTHLHSTVHAQHSALGGATPNRHTNDNQLDTTPRSTTLVNEKHRNVDNVRGAHVSSVHPPVFKQQATMTNRVEPLPVTCIHRNTQTTVAQMKNAHTLTDVPTTLSSSDYELWTQVAMLLNSQIDNANERVVFGASISSVAYQQYPPAQTDMRISNPKWTC